ncbi:amidohydrolase family protein [Pedobacter mucosus]|uniref:amidohydrolase family protein n=1 Tax=Pedobacter mucosus TaxID=2895286 RepID=UPI001EE4AB84|nr:amidohydrolase family protein [Pedobacter mucosus]UKT65079.1 amidohydrolase family protein [Pedobacter mucosus]
MQYKHLLRYFLLLPFLIFVNGCTSLNSGLKNYPQKRFVIKNVNVIPMVNKGEVLLNATVIIENRIIVSINGHIPSDAHIINGKGKWLIPGLVDMHVHVPTDGTFNNIYPTRAAAIFTSTQDVMTPFVANGVTTIFSLNSVVGNFGQRNEIIRGDVIGPRMALAAMINGGNEVGTANTPSDGRQSVRFAKAEGYEFIKVYSSLNTETYKAIVDEAHMQGMKVIGHIPNEFKNKIEEAFVPYFGMVAHAEEYAKQSEDFSYHDAQRFAKLAKQNGTWLSPTLIVISKIAEQTRTLDSIRSLVSLQYVHPLIQNKWLTANKYNIETSSERVIRLEKIVEFNNQLVKAFKETGVPIVAGTDAGSSGVIAGFSLHDELELLVKAGLTTEEALVSATRLPATWLGIESKIGTVESGKFADLVLLDANPLESIKNTRSIFGVFVDGRWLDNSLIKGMLSELSKRNFASKDKYEWSKRGEY